MGQGIQLPSSLYGRLPHTIVEMDIVKYAIEIALNVAGEKRDIGGFEELLKKDRQKLDKKSSALNNEFTCRERRKRTWKWRSKSKIRAGELEALPPTKSTGSSTTSKQENKGPPIPPDDRSRPSCTHNGHTPPDKSSLDVGIAKHDTSVDKNDMSMLQKFALNALNLTAPASSVLLNNRRNSWVQLSGHQGCLAPAGPGTIWKKRSGETNESLAYTKLMQDLAKDIVPTYYKEIQFNGEHFIEMRDLLYDFHNPSVIDIKMGTRTFLESEVTNKKARNDLYQKMIKVDPNAPTEEERLQEAVTKLRYMDFRDNNSSSRSLGFRVDALKMSGTKEVTEVRNVRTREQVLNTIAKFLRNRDSIKKQVVARLKEIKSVFEASSYFRDHEVIGSSILIIYDEDKAGAWMIDFAKTLQLPEGIKTNHRSPWVLGNHEEGYLTGLENLIKVVEEVPTNKPKRLPFFNR